MTLLERILRKAVPDVPFDRVRVEVLPPWLTRDLRCRIYVAGNHSEFWTKFTFRYPGWFQAAAKYHAIFAFEDAWNCRPVIDYCPWFHEKKDLFLWLGETLSLPTTIVNLLMLEGNI